MDPNITREILDDLIPSLEALEARSTAVLEFLEDEGIATDEKLAPYLEQAANASNVRWLGVRVRVERLLSAAEKDSAEKRTEKEEEKPDTTQTKAADASRPESDVVDNSKSAGPENPKEHIDNDKQTDVMGADTAPKTNTANNSPENDNKNGDRPKASEDKSRADVRGEEQKAA